MNEFIELHLKFSLKCVIITLNTFISVHIKLLHKDRQKYMYNSKNRRTPLQTYDSRYDSFIQAASQNNTVVVVKDYGDCWFEHILIYLFIY